MFVTIRRELSIPGPQFGGDNQRAEYRLRAGGLRTVGCHGAGRQRAPELLLTVYLAAEQQFYRFNTLLLGFDLQAGITTPRR
ncbi:MAG: hypothetical protein GPOALKHO_001790 [Sodalis sp.]|nr:MAG: hypothetical protein GPOALKHO_001790 [Sodalis sp.]